MVEYLKTKADYDKAIEDSAELSFMNQSKSIELKSTTSQPIISSETPPP